jgi:Domain of unknown function (DUF4382)
MRRMCTSQGATKASRRGFFTALVFCLSFAGCGDTCFIFVSNPSGGTIAVGSTTCPPNQANGTVHLRLTSSVMPSAGDWSTSVQHIFVTLRGIEANPSATAAEDSPDWQELAPKLATQPMQFDLLAHIGDSCAPNTFGDVAVPADVYRQVRLLLSPSHSEANEPVPQENGCGRVGFNCIVRADGGIRPLLLNRQLPQVNIPPDHLAGGFFRILPETTVNLTIEFNPSASLVFPAGEAVLLVPVFTVDSQAPCESVARFDQ